MACLAGRSARLRDRGEEAAHHAVGQAANSTGINIAHNKQTSGPVPIPSSDGTIQWRFRRRVSEPDAHRPIDSGLAATIQFHTQGFTTSQQGEADQQDADDTCTLHLPKVSLHDC